MRVAIIQPALPEYRIAPFQELAERDGVDLRVWYSQLSGLPSVGPQGFEASEAPSYSLKRLRHSLGWTPQQIAAASRRICDVLILEWNVRNLSLFPAILRAKSAGVRTLLWGHGRGLNETAFRRWVRNLAAKLADGVIVYDIRTARELEVNYLGKQRVFVAQNAIQQLNISEQRDWWLNHKVSLMAFAEDNALLDRSPILYVSRLLETRPLDVLVEAMIRVGRADSSALLVVIGNGDKERRRLERLAHERGAAQFVRFLPGTYDERELAPWFLLAKAFCVPEGVGLTILHAFGYGTPVIIGGDFQKHFPEANAVDPGVTGFVFPHGDAKALGDLLVDIVQDNIATNEISANAIRSVSQIYTVGRMVDGFEQAIRAVTCQGSSGMEQPLEGWWHRQEGPTLMASESAGRQLPLVSVVTPVRNGSAYLTSLLDSVRAQDYPNIEHIVIDDGSDDGGETLRILRAANGVTWRSRENRGQYSTLNEALSLAKGELITIISADDFYVSPFAVSTLVREFLAYPSTDFVSGRTVFVDEDGIRSVVQPPTWQWPRTLLAYGFGLLHCSVLIRRNHIFDNEIFFDTDLAAADRDWLIRIVNASRDYRNLPVAIAAYRRTTGSQVTQISHSRRREESRKITAKYGINRFVRGAIEVFLRARARLIWASCLVRPRMTARLLEALRTGGRGGRTVARWRRSNTNR